MNNKQYLRTILAGTVSVFALANSAMAQSSDGASEAVVVTGTRIQNGNSLPTPVTVVSSEQLQATTPGSIPEALDKLPAFTMAQGNPNNATAGANGRGSGAPGYFLNLRNLGTIRTLILQDGHRVPGTFYDTTVDTDMLPQMLVQRVEVVSGGASAVYGSDAVTGVVNFILDKKFDGLKGVIQGGQSGYGDVRSIRVGFAGGFDIGKGHLIWSAEYRDRDALPDAASRPLGNLGTSIVGAGSKTSPYKLVYGIRQSNVSPGGLIVTGPGKGLQFLNDGSLAPFNPGTPTSTTNFSIGGDGGIEHNEYLLPVTNTGQAFAHYTYDFTDSLSGYVEARYAQARSYEAGQIFTSVNGSNLTTDGSGAQYPITIYSGNAFLTPAQQALLFPAGGPTSFQMSRMNNDLMSKLALTQHTGALSISAGLNGKAWGDFDWDTYYTHGETRTMLTSRGNVNAQRFYAAVDAVKDPTTGNTVCNVSITAPGAFPGCVPLNLFGQSPTVVNGSNASAAAISYIGGPQTDWVAHNGLDDFGANITGTAFDGWAGPIKVALGAEYRLASLDVETTTPDNTFNPQYLRLAPAIPAPNNIFAITKASPAGTFPAANLSRFKEVQSGGLGSENVSEANFEVDAPILKDLPGVQLLSINAAARYTEYNVGGINPTSTSGARAKSSFSASTWKAGVEWQVFDDLKIRATRSRDIRAPTLWDLFQGPVTSTSGVQDSLTGASGSANTNTVGNPFLKPETARNTTAGVVYTPSWLSGFSVSADYFHIAVDNEIAAVSGNNQVVQSLCLASPGGSSPYCNLIQRPISYNNTSPTNFPTLYLSQAQNFQKQWEEGMDFEVNYGTDLSTWTGMNGMFNARLLWTHTAFLKTLGLPGSIITDATGTSALPSEKATLIMDYSLNGIGIDLMERYYGSIRQSSNPTLVFDPSTGDLPSYFITDITVSYDFDAMDVPFTAFFNINNLFDKAPDVYQVPGYTGSPGMNYPVTPYEDLIGRYFTVGLRFKM
ncbi:MAG TPA: TonB-dependent receptor [Rhizomicrobium sp.]